MIHLVAGESALMTLKETPVPGDKFSIDDFLIEGPVEDGLRSESSWQARASYLEQYFSISQSDYLSGKADRDRILTEALKHNEIVLWFEFDLHCQSNLLYFLDWFARNPAQTQLWLICPERIPGRDRFRGLGELRPEELTALFPTRAPVTPEQQQIARLAWQAYGSADPRNIEKFLQSDSSALPLLAPALRAHLERFPSVKNGIGSLGRATLEVLARQPLEFRKLFPRVSDRPEILRHGMGDIILRSYLHMWASGRKPLIEDGDVVKITNAGRSVIENRMNAIELNGIDIWYGGVHLTPDSVWRWDTERQAISPS